MALIYALLVGHFVADFLCQTDWMALNKSKRWDALAWHVAAYIGALYVVLAASAWLGLWSNPHASFDDHWFYVANAGAHFVTDAVTSRITSKLWFISFYPRPDDQKSPSGILQPYGAYPLYAAVDQGNKRHWFFVVIGFDQLLHYVTLFLTAGWWLQ